MTGIEVWCNGNTRFWFLDWGFESSCLNKGELVERLNTSVLKTDKHVSVSGVRIPHSPLTA